jgi:hypothetical protein
MVLRGYGDGTVEVQVGVKLYRDKRRREMMAFRSAGLDERNKYGFE